MLTLRLYGGSHVTSWPCSSMRPEVGASKPPIIRRVVVLPQPDGPEQAEELAVTDLEVDVVDGDGVAERLDHVHELDVDGRHVRWHSLRADDARARARSARTGAGEDMGASVGVSRTRDSRRQRATVRDSSSSRHSPTMESAARRSAVGQPAGAMAAGAAVRYRRVHRQKSHRPPPKGPHRRCSA